MPNEEQSIANENQANAWPPEVNVNSLLHEHLAPVSPLKKRTDVSGIEEDEQQKREAPSGAWRVLRSLAAFFPNSSSLQLLSPVPAHDDAQKVTAFRQVAELQRKKRHWVEGAALEQPVALALPNGGLTWHKISPVEPLLTLPDSYLLVCRNEQAELKGALVITPDLPYALTPDQATLQSIVTQVVLALELDAANTQMQRLVTEAAAEDQARDMFISFVAHELRNPLTAIKGYAQLLARQARKNPLPEAMQRSVQSIEQQSMRMSEMLGEMLDASRILRNKLEILPSTVDLSLLIARVIDRRRGFFPEHTLVFRGTDISVIGNWDQGRVEQILRDLLDNALRHSPIGATVEIEMTPAPDVVTVVVRDRGIGILENEQQRLFEYLYHTPDSERRNLAGVGLGLFVSRHLAERLGGHLWLQASSTTPPSGSEFRFTLPLTPSARGAENI